MPHPSAEASSVLQRPSGASMLAAASAPMVRGSSVSSAAAATARPHLPARISVAASAMEASEDEHAVSTLMAGPAAARNFEKARKGRGLGCGGGGQRNRSQDEEPTVDTLTAGPAAGCEKRRFQVARKQRNGFHGSGGQKYMRWACSTLQSDASLWWITLSHVCVDVFAICGCVRDLQSCLRRCAGSVTPLTASQLDRPKRMAVAVRTAAPFRQLYPFLLRACTVVFHLITHPESLGHRRCAPLRRCSSDLCTLWVPLDSGDACELCRRTTAGKAPCDAEAAAGHLARVRACQQPRLIDSFKRSKNAPLKPWT